MLKIKVCGVTDPANARAVATAGADWIGLNFFPGSKRFVTPEQAGAIVDALPDSTQAVGLFVDAPIEHILEIARRLNLSTLQLHGNEPPEFLPQFDPSWTIVRAFRLRDATSIEAMQAYLERASTLGRPPDAVLIDADTSGHFGGTGQTIAADLLPTLPPLPRLILAGGLNPENVTERVNRLPDRPWMVDVASGVESRPGIKDLDRVRELVRAVHMLSAGRTWPGNA